MGVKTLGEPALGLSQQLSYCTVGMGVMEAVYHGKGQKSSYNDSRGNVTRNVHAIDILFFRSVMQCINWQILVVVSLINIRIISYSTTLGKMPLKQIFIQNLTFD